MIMCEHSPKNLEKNLDHFIESARNLVFSDSIAFENPIDLAPNFPSQQTLLRCPEAIVQDFLHTKSEGCARDRASGHDDP
jgi:hypothetical protein